VTRLTVAGCRNARRAEIKQGALSFGTCSRKVSAMSINRKKQSAFLTAAIVLLCATAGYAQEEPKGSYIDGVFVEGYEYKPQFITNQELKKLVDAKSKDIVIVDTANPLIFEEHHIPGAVNLPYGPALPQPLTLPRNKTLVIYCACNAEEESIDVATKLTEFGYQNLKVLKGGWSGWLERGYKIEAKERKGAPGPRIEVAAGLAPGAPTPSVPILDVTGAYAGKRTCYVCEFQNDPNVIAFFREANDQTAELIVQLDKLYKQEKSKKFKAVAILVPGPSAKAWLEDLRKSRKLEIPLTVLASGPNDVGVKLYKLDPKVRNTFLVTRNRIVDTNLTDITSTDFNKVKQATSSMLTKSVATKQSKK
jgi:rhodanese-related sulfurtransferase